MAFRTQRRIKPVEGPAPPISPFQARAKLFLAEVTERLKVAERDRRVLTDTLEQLETECQSLSELVTSLRSYVELEGVPSLEDVQPESPPCPTCPQCGRYPAYCICSNIIICPTCGRVGCRCNIPTGLREPLEEICLNCGSLNCVCPQ